MIWLVNSFLQLSVWLVPYLLLGLRVFLPLSLQVYYSISTTTCQYLFKTFLSFRLADFPINFSKIFSYLFTSKLYHILTHLSTHLGKIFFNSVWLFSCCAIDNLISVWYSFFLKCKASVCLMEVIKLKGKGCLITFIRKVASLTMNIIPYSIVFVKYLFKASVCG